MAALSAGRVTQEWAPLTVQRSYQMAVSSQIWEGGIVALNASGYAGAAGSGTGQVAVGVAMLSLLSTSSTSNRSNITVHTGTFHLLADSAFGLTAIGSNCYLIDDQTVSLTATGHSLAGVVEQIDSDGNPFVKIGL